MKEQTVTKNEIALARKKKQSAYRRRRALHAAIVLAVIAAVITTVVLLPSTAAKDLSSAFKSFFAYGSWPVSLGASSFDSVQPLDAGFAVSAGDRVTVYSNTGAQLQSISVNYTAPVTVTHGNKLLVYASDGTEARLYNRTEAIASFTTQQRILSADTAGGRVALLTASSRYTGEVTVSSAGGEELFTWYCAEGFPYLVRFSDNGSRLCVAAMVIENGRFDTRVTVLDINSSSEVFTAAVEGTVHHVFFAGRALLCLSDTGATPLSETGELGTPYRLEGRTLLALAEGPGGQLALALGYGGHDKLTGIVVLGRGGALQTEFAAGIPVRDLCITKNELYLLSEGRVEVVDYTGASVRTLSCSYSASRLLLCGGDPVVFAGGTAAKAG